MFLLLAYTAVDTERHVPLCFLQPMLLVVIPPKIGKMSKSSIINRLSQGVECEKGHGNGAELLSSQPHSGCAPLSPEMFISPEALIPGVEPGVGTVFDRLSGL